MTNAEMKSALEALTGQLADAVARVETLESEIGHCKNVQSIRYGAVQRARVMENGRRLKALIAEPAKMIAEYSSDELRALTGGMNSGDILTIAKTVDGELREKLLAVVALNNRQTRAWIEHHLRPAAKVVRVAAQQLDGRRHVGTVHYGPKNTYLLNMEAGWTGLAADWSAVLKEDAQGNGGVAERIAIGVLVVTELSEAEAYQWSWTERHR